MLLFHCIAALHHFYDMNDIAGLNWKKISSFIGENIKTVKDRPYTKEEISKLLDAAQDKRLKIAILLMCSSGLRIGSISELKLGSLEPISRYGIYQITVYENTKQEYITFCTPECASVINSYLEYRKRNGDRLKPSEPLLRDEFDINDSIRAASPKTLSTFSLRARIFTLLVSSGLRERKPELEKISAGEGEKYTRPLHRRRKVMQCHGLRKFFSTTCTLEGLPPLTVEILIGHRALGLTGVYFKPSPNDLLEGNDKMMGYANVIDALTIGDEHRLRPKNGEIMKRNQRLEKEKDEVANLKQQLEPLLALKYTLIQEGVLKES